MLLQEEWPFENDRTKKAQSLIQKGQRPSLYDDVWNSKDKYLRAIRHAMIDCHGQDPAERASAHDIQEYLLRKMRELDPGEIEKWPAF